MRKWWLVVWFVGFQILSRKARESLEFSGPSFGFFARIEDVNVFLANWWKLVRKFDNLAIWVLTNLSWFWISSSISHFWSWNSRPILFLCKKPSISLFFGPIPRHWHANSVVCTDHVPIFLFLSGRGTVPCPNYIHLGVWIKLFRNYMFCDILILIFFN